MTVRSFDAVIIGGGVNGAAVAYYLAQSGVTDVLLVEAEDHGAGATGGSMGNVRQQFGTPLEIECSRRGLEFWKTAEQVFDSPCQFHMDGYLMLTGNEDTAELLRQHAQVQIDCGMPDIELLTPDQIVDVAPCVSPKGLIVGSWTPHDGHVLPMDGLVALLKAAKAKGIEVELGWKADAVTRDGDGWLVRGREDLRAGMVFVVAGAGTKELVQPFGIDLDMQTAAHRALLTEPYRPGERVPFTIDLDTGLAIERDGSQLMLAMLARNPAPDSHEQLAEMYSEAAESRSPELMDLKIVNRLTAWPVIGGDGHPYVGTVDDGLHALAFTGHGAMHGPPVAKALVQAALGTPDESLDLREWDLRRTPGPRSVLWRRKATS